ncbi:MAG TPA: hypothetical protein VK519_07945, partial [Pinirhizobacter sp.]|uniref:hypothetical protein n=1 Tax=Pinirhizobacter sp. TaxID=2950432 RepID=UPI002C5DB099
MRSNSLFRSRAFKRTVLAVALSSTLAGGVAFAQSTTGSIFGQAPAAAGETVGIDSGGTRGTGRTGNGNGQPRPR